MSPDVYRYGSCLSLVGVVQPEGSFNLSLSSRRAKTRADPRGASKFSGYQPSTREIRRFHRILPSFLPSDRLSQI